MIGNYLPWILTEHVGCLSLKSDKGILLKTVFCSDTSLVKLKTRSEDGEDKEIDFEDKNLKSNTDND